MLLISSGALQERSDTASLHKDHHHSNSSDGPRSAMIDTLTHGTGQILLLTLSDLSVQLINDAGPAAIKRLDNKALTSRKWNHVNGKCINRPLNQED